MTETRDVDIVDALNTARGQYVVFSPSDVSIAQRTALEAYTNDTGQWAQWYDFKASSVLTAHAHVLYTGDVSLAAALWSDDDASIRSQGDARYNSMQFYSGAHWYANASGNGMFAFPADGSCHGSWACEPLVDWPTGTRDGYSCAASNAEDTVRSSLGAMALHALADTAGWLARPVAAARYAALEAATLAALRRLNVRRNGSEAYFVDGAVGASASHAAVHSTLYAISAGAADGDADLGRALTAFLSRHGVAPSSCMMVRRSSQPLVEGRGAAALVRSAPSVVWWCPRRLRCPCVWRCLTVTPTVTPLTIGSLVGLRPLSPGRVVVRGGGARAQRAHVAHVPRVARHDARVQRHHDARGVARS